MLVLTICQDWRTGKMGDPLMTSYQMLISSEWFLIICVRGCPLRINGLTSASSSASSSFVISIPCLDMLSSSLYSFCAYSALYRYLSNRQSLECEQLLHTYGGLLSIWHGSYTKYGHFLLHWRHSLHGILHLCPRGFLHTSRCLQVYLCLQLFGVNLVER